MMTTNPQTGSPTTILVQDVTHTFPLAADSELHAGIDMVGSTPHGLYLDGDLVAGATNPMMHPADPESLGLFVIRYNDSSGEPQETGVLASVHFRFFVVKI